MKRILIVMLAAWVVSAVGCSGAGNPEAEKAAVAAAEKWLALMDAGSYAASWDEAASIFKSAVPKEQWAVMAGSVEAPLGKMQSRKVASLQYLTQVPNAPAGQYVVIQFNTSFENKKGAVETVTPMLDTDGQWRVSGYYIK